MGSESDIVRSGLKRAPPPLTAGPPGHIDGRALVCPTRNPVSPWGLVCCSSPGVQRLGERSSGIGATRFLQKPAIVALPSTVSHSKPLLVISGRVLSTSIHLRLLSGFMPPCCCRAMSRV
jgi:hypothetical protein